MREIKQIIIHCTATPEGRDVSVDTIRGWHLKNGWRDIGYHYVIALDGTVDEGRPMEMAGAHTKGHNASSIGVVYVGGCDADMNPKDTRTEAQRRSLVELVKALKVQYPNATIHGHREFAAKACPSFDVQEWLQENNL